MGRRIKHTVIYFITIMLVACSTYVVNAPVRDVNTKKNGATWYYTVQDGDTLYSAAWRNNLDFQKLAELNGLVEPYKVFPGQKLKLNGKIIKSKKNVSVKVFEKIHKWNWPYYGRVIHTYSAALKGIDIQGRKGEAVHASASGVVVYAGFGIPGYRGLIIIKHNAEYLSAYGYNSKLLVKQNQHVNSRQKIAIMGTDLSGKPMLHFEIRKYGKAVNPNIYLR